MKRRIQQSMGLILGIALLMSCVLFSFIVYQENKDLMQSAVEKEAEYISEAMNASNEQYLDEIIKYIGTSRITIINPDGVVIYDTEKNIDEMENHKYRDEIIQARKDGVGQSTRMSTTLGKTTFYTAILLDNQDVVRISKTMDSVWDMLFEFLPWIILIGIFLEIVTLILARWQTQRLIEPINMLDVDNPLENDLYDELKPLLKKIHESKRAQEQVADMRKEFSANVSHELKTPLTSISGYAELMQNGLVKPEHIEGFAGKIHAEASRLIVLVEYFIKLSKLDEGSIELEKENVDLYNMMLEIKNRLLFTANKKNVDIIIDGQSAICKGVRQVLDEMFYNICENAIKYNRDGGSVRIWVGQNDEGAKVIVHDTGIGIPDNQQDRVFERFYRVDKSHSKETGGTGLGLSIVKHGAVLHHAKIELNSKTDEGTEITILFPKHCI